MSSPVTLIRVPGLRRMSLRVKPTGDVIVRASSRVSDGDIQAFIAQHESWIEKQSRRYEAMELLHPDEIVELRLLAQSYLPHRTMELSLELGFQYRSVSCRHQKSRWGSCSSSNAISLNIELMRLPQRLQDYVIIHELTHTIHKHHQDTFWSYLEKVLPGAIELDKQLKHWRIGYKTLSESSF